MLIRSTDLGQQVRKYVLDHFLEFSVPPVVEQIMKRFRLDRGQSFEGFQWLEAARHLRLLPGTQRILMPFPFSAVPTPFIAPLLIPRVAISNCATLNCIAHATVD